jgi:hypothetical protein
MLPVPSFTDGDDRERIGVTSRRVFMKRPLTAHVGTADRLVKSGVPPLLVLLCDRSQRSLTLSRCAMNGATMAATASGSAIRATMISTTSCPVVMPRFYGASSAMPR